MLVVGMIKAGPYRSRKESSKISHHIGNSTGRCRPGVVVCMPVPANKSIICLPACICLTQFYMLYIRSPWRNQDRRHQTTRIKIASWIHICNLAFIRPSFSVCMHPHASEIVLVAIAQHIDPSKTRRVNVCISSRELGTDQLIIHTYIHTHRCIRRQK